MKKHPPQKIIVRQKREEYIATPDYTTLSIHAAKKRKENVSRGEHRRHLQTLSILEKTSKHLAVETNIKSILKKIATTVGKALGAKYVNFWNFTPDKQGAYIFAAYGMQQQYITHSHKDPIPLGEAWIGRAMKTGQAWATSNVQKDPLLPSSWLPAAKKQNYHGLLCVPLTRKKNIVGGMCIYYKDIHRFDSFEMSVITIVANQAATAVENARIVGDLLAERTKTLAVVQSLDDGLIMYDPEGKVIFFNPRAQELLWIRSKQVIGKKIDASLAQKDAYLKNLFQINRLANVNFQTKEYATEGPQKLILAVTRIPVRNPQRQKIGAMHILRDITPQKELEQLKSNFISTASHQLRTPLTGMKWSLSALLKEEAGALIPKQKELIAQIAAVTDYSVGLVNDLLDAARIEEGKFGYAFTPDNGVKIVEKVVQNLEINAKEQNISVLISHPALPLPSINIDKPKFDIAVHNIIDNAIRYSRTGNSVHISFHASPDFFEIRVKDNGIGVPEKAKKFIFEKFFRAENAVRLRPEGSGLGLYIAKSIVEKHNGRIILAKSEIDKGSIFVIQLPLDPKKMPRGAVKK